MEVEDVTAKLAKLDDDVGEIQEVLHVRKEQASLIALQELKNVLNDSEKDDLTTPFNVDPQSIDILLSEYQKGINLLQKKYISSGSFENMMERIFALGDNKEDIVNSLEKELHLQEKLIKETEQLEDTLDTKKLETHKVLEKIKERNSLNFNVTEKEINGLIEQVVAHLQKKNEIENLFVKINEDSDEDVCDVFDKEFISVIDEALQD
ncbi:hypothetical protein QEN19_002987 [Hanseniaspora menglaensis]